MVSVVWQWVMKPIVVTGFFGDVLISRCQMMMLTKKILGSEGSRRYSILDW